VNGHPREGSLSDALAEAYMAGAGEAGAEVRGLRIADMRFEPNVLSPSPTDQHTEPSVEDAMCMVAWADHIVFVFPTWWGTMPALLKGFLDRVLMPGFAFEDRNDGEGWDKLLTGKSAHLLTTMDTPPFVYKWIYGAPGLNGLARATLGFCGITPVRRSIFGPVKGSDLRLRERWLAEARAAGEALRGGVLRPSERIIGQVLSWIAALRLQFYPMVWGAYGLGAAAALYPSGNFAAAPFWLGLACLFALEAATVFVNELFDWESDRRNTHAGPFTGGSRVLVEGRLKRTQMKVGVGVALLAAAGFALTLPAASAAPLVLLALLTMLAIGYTAPPLKLCWRGLGEFDVAATHSVLVVLFGYALQGGSLANILPWALGVPLFFAVLPSITLSGIPDHDADRAAGKRTLAVLLALTLQFTGPFTDVFRWFGLFVVPHTAFLVVRLERYLDNGRAPGRIDGLMALSLLYIVWFVAVPLWWLTHTI
jgi:putative NADPH-quinone reductase/1,4-dihydroxy-2-naphthoate octaprenyltransferase